MKKIIQIFCVWILVCSLSVNAFALNTIETVLVTEGNNENIIVLESDQPLKFSAKASDSNKSIEISFTEPLKIDAGSVQIPRGSLIQKINYQQDSEGTVKNLTIELKETCSFSVIQNDWTLSINIKKDATPSAKKQKEEPSLTQNLPAPVTPDTAKLPTETSNTQYNNNVYKETELVSPKDYTNQDLSFELENVLKDLQDLQEAAPRAQLPENPTLQDFVRVALLNNKNLDIADQEYVLAKKKRFEAKRAFFPSITGKLTDTSGKTLTNPDDSTTEASFTRKELGVEFGQPLFQSGQIYYSQKQAQMQVGVSQIQIQKIINDSTFETIKSLMAFLQAQEILKLRENLENKILAITETTRKKRNLGLSSESELLGAEATATQIRYKVISQQKDKELASSNLSKELGIKETPNLDNLKIDAIYKNLTSQKITMDQLLKIALVNRPEIKIAFFNLKAREYAKKSSRAETLVKIDASGFFGQSGSAFASEKLTLKDSYNIGIRANIFFAGNSLSPLLSKEKTAPDLGSTSRSETDGRTLNVGVLDALGSLNTYQQAKIDESKAWEEMRKTKKDISKEVQEAYYNFQKADVQVDFAKKELEYRTKELAIAVTRDKIQSVETSELIQAYLALGEAEISLKEATAFWVTSLYALEKAIGKKL